MYDLLDTIPNLLFLIMFACVYNHPKVKTYITKTAESLFFQEKHLHLSYVQPRVKTYKDLEIKKFMNTERWKYKLVDPESLVSILKKFKHLIIQMTILNTTALGVVEKLKNIVTWQDPLRTVIFLSIVTLAYCITSDISMRIVILFAGFPSK